MNGDIVLDSVILIDHFNAVSQASAYLEQVGESASITAITRAEVLTGFDSADPARRFAAQSVSSARDRWPSCGSRCSASAGASLEAAGCSTGCCRPATRSAARYAQHQGLSTGSLRVRARAVHALISSNGVNGASARRKGVTASMVQQAHSSVPSGARSFRRFNLCDVLLANAQGTSAGDSHSGSGGA